MFINIIFFKFVFNNFDIFFIIIFLVFIVCERVLGLAIFISIIRNFGNNNLYNFFFLKI